MLFCIIAARKIGKGSRDQESETRVTATRQRKGLPCLSCTVGICGESVQIFLLFTESF